MYKYWIIIILNFILISNVYPQSNQINVRDSLKKYYHIDYKKAVVFSDSLLRKAKLEKNDSLLFSALENKLGILLFHGKAQEFLDLRNSIEKLINTDIKFKKQHLITYVKIKIIDGVHNSLNLKNYNNAIAEFNTALEIAKTIYDVEQRQYLNYQIYNWLSSCYKSLGKYHDAIISSEKAIDIYIKTNKVKDINAVNDLLIEFQTIGLLYEKIGDKEKSKNLMQLAELKSIRLFNKLKKEPHNRIYVLPTLLAHFDYCVKNERVSNAEETLENISKILFSRSDTLDYIVKKANLEYHKKNYSTSGSTVEKALYGNIELTSYFEIEFRKLLTRNLISMQNWKQADRQIDTLFKLSVKNENNNLIYSNSTLILDSNLLESLEMKSKILFNNFKKTPTSELKDTIRLFAKFTFYFLNAQRKRINSINDLLLSSKTYDRVIESYIRLFSEAQMDLDLYNVISFAKYYSINFTRIKKNLLENIIPEKIRLKEIELNNLIQEYKDSINIFGAQSHYLDSLITMNNDLILFEAENIFKHKVFDNLNVYNNRESVKDFKKSLRKDQSILNYFISDKLIHIFHIKRDSITYYKESNLDSLKKYLRIDIINLKDKNSAENLDKISKLLLPSDLQLNKNVTIIPHSLLNYLPFEILNFKNQLLLENFNIGYSFTNEVTLNKDRHFFNQPKFYGLAPSFNNMCSDFSKLDFNKSEVENIAKKFDQQKTYYDKTYKLDEILFDLKNYNVAHFATHTYINEENSDSTFISLGENCIDTTNNKIFIKDFLRSDINLELVTLSSCNTGIGKLINGEGLSSLSKAMFYSNVDAVVSSLWNVNDQSTSEIMFYFYTFLRKGMKKDEALRKAKLSYINNADPDYKHPYYWAGFILIGDPSPLFQTPYLSVKALAIIVLILIVLIFIILQKKNKKSI